MSGMLDPSVEEKKVENKLKEVAAALESPLIQAEIEPSPPPSSEPKKKPKMKKIRPLFKNPFRSIPKFRNFKRMDKSSSSRSEPTLADSDSKSVSVSFAESDSGFDLESPGGGLFSGSSTPSSDIETMNPIPEFKTLSLPNTCKLKQKRIQIVETQSNYSDDSRDDSDTLVDELITVPEHLLSKKLNKNKDLAEKTYHFKVLVIGDPGVGKTAFVHRYTANTFRSDYRSTVGVDFAMKVLHLPGNVTVRVQLWDIAGQERFTWMTRVYYKESQGCIIIMDLTSQKSMENVRRWKQDLDSKVTCEDGSPIPTLLLANKCDLQDRAITPAQVEGIFEEYNFLGWCEISAKQDIMVADAVRFLIDSMIENEDSKGDDSNKEVLKEKQEELENTVILKEEDEVYANQKASGCCGQ